MAGPGREEAWLGGPVPGVDALLVPVAHALLQALDDVTAATAELDPEQVWARPGGAASVGYHLAHLAGATDRLFTYARGEALSDDQREALGVETTPRPGTGAAALVAAFGAAVDVALAQLRATPRSILTDARKVGRAGRPSTVIGALFHAGEHAARHAGQVVTTAKVVRAAAPARSRP